MTARAGAVLAGAWAALTAPLWLGGERLASLLHAPAGARDDAEPPRGAVGSALTLLRYLARVPRSPWRDTCLYRSAAECLVLRRYGVPALVRIGVKNEGGSIIAHAWVVRAGEEASEAASPGAMQPLVVRG